MQRLAARIKATDWPYTHCWYFWISLQLGSASHSEQEEILHPSLRGYRLTMTPGSILKPRDLLVLLPYIWFPVLSHFLPHNSQSLCLFSIENSRVFSSMPCPPPPTILFLQEPESFSWVLVAMILSPPAPASPQDSANLSLWLWSWLNNPEPVMFAGNSPTHRQLCHLSGLLLAVLCQGLASSQATTWQVAP